MDDNLWYFDSELSDIYVDILMPIGTRRGKLEPSVTDPDTIKTNMATPSEAAEAEADISIDGSPDRNILLQILNNQKIAEKKSEERYAKLSNKVDASKKATVK